MKSQAIFPIIYLFILKFCVVFTLQAQVYKESLNDAWEFAYSTSEKDAKDFVMVNIPHTWNKEAYQVKNYRRGAGLYRKTFHLSREDKNNSLYLKFEGVNSYAKVFLNDSLVGEHAGGYTAFSLPINAFVKYDSKNELKVFVENTNQNIPPLSGDFTIFGGIYRDVWLVRENNIHFSHTKYGAEGVWIEQKNVSEKFAQLYAKANISTNLPKVKLCLSASLKDQEGNIVAHTSQKFTTTQNGNVQIGFENIQEPKLWSPDSPYLYELEVNLKDASGKKSYDRYTSKVGFRWFSIGDNNEFVLNGKALKLIGVCRHQDQAPYGIALSDEMHRRDIQLAKDLGANFIRIAHYPQDPVVLEECDRLGLLVWEEIPIVDIIADNDAFKENARTALKEMIHQHYNHSSIVMWGYMNEAIIQVQYRIKDKTEKQKLYTATTAFAQELEALLKNEDPNRLSVMAYHGTQLYHEIGLSSVSEISGWNLYHGWYENGLENFDQYLQREHSNYPERPLLVSEFGAGSDNRLHTTNPQRLDFSMEWQQLYMEHYLPFIQNTPYIMGGTMWNMIDFSSALRQESMPRINNKGLLYNDRTPKDVFYYYQSFLRQDKDILHLAVRDWMNRTVVADENTTVTHPVKIYSNIRKVHLYHNGILLGEKETNNFHAIWEVALKEGDNQLKVVAESPQGMIEDFANVKVDFIPADLNKTSKNNFEIAINAGSNCSFTDEGSDLVWVADQAYTAGKWGYVNGEPYKRGDVLGTTAEVKGTFNDPLYQTKRIGDVVHYRFDLPNGEYELELSFADLFAHKTKLAYELTSSEAAMKGISVFDIQVNEQLITADFSAIKLAGSHFALRKKINVIVTNGYLELKLNAIEGSAFLNALKLRQL